MKVVYENESIYLSVGSALRLPKLDKNSIWD